MSQSYERKRITIPFKWEKLQDNANSTIVRAKVYGGWIVNSFTESPSKKVSEAMVFVPDPNHEWEL